MKYPKLSCKASKRDKFCKDEKQKVKELHRKGLNHREISEKLKMSQTTVRYVLDKKAKKRGREQSRKINKKRYKTDPEFYNMIKKHATKRVRERYQNDPEFRKYVSSYGKKYYIKNSEYIIKRGRKWRNKIINDPVKKKKYLKHISEHRKEQWKNMSRAEKKIRIKISSDWHKNAYKDPVKKAKLIKSIKKYHTKNTKKFKKYYKDRWKKIKNNPKLMAKYRKANKIAVIKYQAKKKLERK